MGRNVSDLVGIQFLRLASPPTPMPSNYEERFAGTAPRKRSGVAEPATSFILNGGLELVHGARMRPGAITSGRTKLVEYRERETWLGLMLITITETTWTNQRDQMVRETPRTGLRQRPAGSQVATTVGVSGRKFRRSSEKRASTRLTAMRR